MCPPQNDRRLGANFDDERPRQSHLTRTSVASWTYARLPQRFCYLYRDRQIGINRHMAVDAHGSTLARPYKQAQIGQTLEFLGIQPTLGGKGPRAMCDG